MKGNKLKVKLLTAEETLPGDLTANTRPKVPLENENIC